MNDKNRTEKIEVERCQMLKVYDSLRLVANHHNAQERESCLDRIIMSAINIIADILNGEKQSSLRYSEKGQYPVLKDPNNKENKSKNI